MGQEITHTYFSKRDFLRYQQRLEDETTHLIQSLAKQQQLANTNTNALMIGAELEVCLLDQNALPLCDNVAFLEALKSPLAELELAQFNLELNTTPQYLKGGAFSAYYYELQQLWQQAQVVAKQRQAQLAMIGILPTLEDKHLSINNMSARTRYRVLNQEVLHLRQGKPIYLNIEGRENLSVVHKDVMLEAATTSLQIHLQVPLSHAVAYYNAAIALSAPMLALTANSPYLFGRALWEETRIPLFEQAVSLGSQDAIFGPIKRVTLGESYLHHSVTECFIENQAHYPVLLPEHFSEEVAELSHLQLHNGTIWRWNRPLVSRDEQGFYHIRLEHRVVPAGPSLVDIIANSVFFYGVLEALVQQKSVIAQQLPFYAAKNNFYLAAKKGLKSRLLWLDGKEIASRVLLKQLVFMAREGLQYLHIDDADIDKYLDIITSRIETGQTGSVWQRKYIKKYGHNMQDMLQSYLRHQEGGLAVHEWPIE